MTIEQLRTYKKILLVGYGTEGKATHEFLKKMHPEATISIADRETDGSGYLDKQQDFDLAIKTPSAPASLLTIPYTTATNIFFANVKGMTIGITGSKGKSTTTALIYHLLKKTGKNAHLVGNITHKLNAIGEPTLAGLLETNTSDDIWVVELASYMLEDSHFSPRIALFTSFFPEHMDHHKTVENYIEAKSHITMFQTSDDYFIYNPNFPEIVTLSQQTKAKAIPFIETLPFPVSDIPLIGQHNVDNVKGAVTLAQLLHIPDEIILQAIKTFQPLPHRLTNIGTYQGITFYDDAIATNPQATIAALQALPPIGTLFLGGSEKQSNFHDLAQEIVNRKIPYLVLFPTTGKVILSEIQKIGRYYQPTTYEATSMHDAVQFAYEHTPKGTICLLSTGSPSFSLWSGYEEKGNEFTKEVTTYHETR